MRKQIRKDLDDSIQAEIEKAKHSPSFPREYQLMYQGKIGNLIDPAKIEHCQQIEEYDPKNIMQGVKTSMSIDPSFGSSKFGIVVTQFVNGRIRVVIAEEHERPDFSDMINRVWEINLMCGKLNAIYVDAANPEIWQSLKKEFDERYDNQYVMDKLNWCRKYNYDPANHMLVIPIPFSSNFKQMTQHLKAK